MAMPGQYSNAPQGGQGGYGQGSFQQQPLMQGGYGGYGPPEGNYPQQGYPQQNAASSSLKRMPITTSLNLVFFGAACCIMVGSFIGGIFLFFSFELVDFLEMCYLCAFGVVLAVLDTPFFKTSKPLADLKMYVGKYINFLTRLTGKGITFIFLGSALFSTMESNLEGGFLRFLSVLVSLAPTVAGIMAVVFGVSKSQKLNKARRLLEVSNIEQSYNQFAQTYPGPTGGLTPPEFNSLTMEHGGYMWEDADLKLIFNALVSNPLWRINSAVQTNAGGRNPEEHAHIPKDDLMAWIKGGIQLI